MRHRKSPRLTGYDYSAAGATFVTFCTAGRRSVLGQFRDDALFPTSSGQIVQSQIALLGHRLHDIEIDTAVVMPNHVHMVVVRWARQASPLRAVVAAVKAGSAREINLARGTPGAPAWQRGYHDHIIRDESDLERVRQYIANNPLRWALDHENPNRTGLDPYPWDVPPTSGRPRPIARPALPRRP